MIVGYTPPLPSPGQRERCVELLQSGAIDILHLRHPELPLEEMRRLLNEFPEHLLHRLTLHDHPELLLEYGVGGFHLNGRCPEMERGIILNNLCHKHSGNALRISKSLHRLHELDEASDWRVGGDKAPFDYVTLSPVFPSISKEGYEPEFDFEMMKRSVANAVARGVRVVALGGVEPDKASYLKQLGFSGMAMLGAIWR